MSDQPEKLRYSVSLVKQGKHQFYTLTMPSDILAVTCSVTTRKENPETGFQRELDKKRAQEIADYIDQGLGTIPNSIVLSAQPSAELKIVGKGKTVEFNKVPAAFLILDGQHRVFGFSLADTSLRVPVVIYNNLSRKDETRLFIDINTKQKPVPAALLLDIKRLADIETDNEITLRDLFDNFNSTRNTALSGRLSAYETASNKISRVTFNSAVKPLLDRFSSRSTDEIFRILDNYLTAINNVTDDRFSENALTKPVVFRAVLGVFPSVAQRVSDKFGPHFTAENFDYYLKPVFSNLPKKKIDKPGTSWTALRDYLAERVSAKQTF